MQAALTTFQHLGPLHLLGTVFGLVVFAPRVARAIGWLRCVALALIAGELANRASALLIDRPIVGASAAVLALAGAWLVLFRHDRSARAGIVLLVAVQLVFAAAALDFGGVAWCAHLVGAALGVVFALAARPVRSSKAIAAPN